MFGDIVVLLIIFILFCFAIRHIKKSKSCCSCGMNCNNKTCKMCREKQTYNQDGKFIIYVIIDCEKNGIDNQRINLSVIKQ